MSDVRIRVIPIEDITICFYSADVTPTICRHFEVYQKKSIKCTLKEGESGYSLNLEIRPPIPSS